MNKLLLAAFIFLLVNTSAHSQDIPVRTLPNQIFRSVQKDANDTAWRWKRGGLANLSLSQGSLSNWSAGGDKFSMALSSYINYSLFYRHLRQTWDNSLDFNFGYVQTTSLGSLKNDDRLDYLSKFGYNIDTTGKWYLSGLFNFRSQFFDGRAYASKDVSTLTSTFLSPAYVVLSVGFDYKPSPTVSLFMSPLTNRSTIVASKRIDGRNFGLDSGKNVYNEIGAFATVNYFKAINKLVTYRGRLDLFSNYSHNPQDVDMYMTNLFSVKINRFLSATYSLDMIYDDDVVLKKSNSSGPGLQLKSQVGFGFSMPFAQEKR